MEAEVSGWNPEGSAACLLAALDAAAGDDGYGECFWPEPTGHYWWMFKREDRSLETAVLVVGTMLAAGVAAQQAATSIHNPFETYALPNGLNVILSPDHATPTVA